MMNFYFRILSAMVSMVMLAACAVEPPTPTVTLTALPSKTPTLTFTPTRTATVTLTFTPTNTPAPTKTPTLVLVFKSLLEMKGPEDCVQLGSLSDWIRQSNEWYENNPDQRADAPKLDIQGTTDTGGFLLKNFMIATPSRGLKGSYPSCASQEGITYYMFPTMVTLNDGTTGLLYLPLAAQLDEMKILAEAFPDFQGFWVSPEEIFIRFAHPLRPGGWYLQIPTSNVDYTETIKGALNIDFGKTHQLLQELPPEYFELMMLVATEQITSGQLAELNGILSEHAVPVDLGAWISKK
jgi:hypothetical protein